ncbi:hypothetical protein F7725_028482 [Dissostichus mawsoni]|uniref:Uncharacterized protein n=1 Tax=Dissostichus mawsoni TaxID=36200 RepID=A0A7J5XFW7_DISMA|nr:hypothetical protein F7725_028482 [Dissostichus mawsoni]
MMVSLLSADEAVGASVSPCCLDDGVDTFYDKLERENRAGKGDPGSLPTLYSPKEQEEFACKRWFISASHGGTSLKRTNINQHSWDFFIVVFFLE